MHCIDTPRPPRAADESCMISRCWVDWNLVENKTTKAQIRKGPPTGWAYSYWLGLFHLKSYGRGCLGFEFLVHRPQPLWTSRPGLDGQNRPHLLPILQKSDSGGWGGHHVIAGGQNGPHLLPILQKSDSGWASCYLGWSKWTTSTTYSAKIWLGWIDNPATKKWSNTPPKPRRIDINRGVLRIVHIHDAKTLKIWPLWRVLLNYFITRPSIKNLYQAKRARGGSDLSDCYTMYMYYP